MTDEQAQAIIAIRGGADVYDYGLAKTLRGMQRAGLPVATDEAPRVRGALFEITKPMMPAPSVREKQPYFGAIATRHGLRLARQVAS